MPTERIRDPEQLEFEEVDEEFFQPNPLMPGKKFFGWVTPEVGPYKGQRIAVYRRGSSGVHGNLESTEEDVYVFFYELKKPARRIKA